MTRFLALSCFIMLYGLGYSQHKNRLNKYGQRTGRWITYSDSAKTKKLFNGRFRNGKNIGRAYYYTMDGVLERKEISRFKKLKTVIYFPDGQKSMVGQARIEDLPDKVHYYFYGRWKYYNEKGRLIKYAYFEKGKLIRNDYIGDNKSPLDTLNRFLLALDQTFTKKNSALINSINLNDPMNSEPYREKLFKNDTASFAKTGRFLVEYGYPDSSFSSEAANVPFFILSYGPISIREKYLDLLKVAAAQGSLSRTALSFYIDKLQLAKGEKQVYGTQYYLKNMEVIYFPILDPEDLHKRRALAGLED